MICVKCGAEVADAPFCGSCGWKQSQKPKPRTRRGNGEGSVLKLSSGRYKAVVVLGYYNLPDGTMRRKTRTKTFEKKKDAVAALVTLRKEPKQAKQKTVQEIYTAWLPTHRAGKSTLDCYKAAWKYLKDVSYLPFADVEIDDWQECIDDCPKGKRTKENMRALIGLLYKYAIPRHLTRDNLVLSQYLYADGDGAAHREAFTELELARIKRGCGEVPYADDVWIMCYLGFRPSEYLALTAESYDGKKQVIIGGAKTDAGRNRIVTISPKIASMVEHRVARGGTICQTPEGKAWSDLKAFSEKAFYPALEACGIDNPMVEIGGGVLRHRLTPHSCRHTFATMLKRVQGADKDKLELIGHTSDEMLRYYQDVSIEDLRTITDAI